MGKLFQGLLFFFIFLFISSAWAEPYDIAKVRPDDSPSSAVGIEICHALEGGNASFQIDSRIETTEAGENLLRFYGTRCRPVWSNEGGLDNQAYDLVYAIENVSENGLEMYDPAYHLESILTLIGRIRSDTFPDTKAELLAELDILLTDAYMMLGKHLYSGVLPRELAPEQWTIAVKKPLDVGLRLRKALQNNALQESLDQLAPSSPPYQALKTAMEKYLRIKEAGGWRMIIPNNTNGRGIDSYSAEDIKERLRVEEDFAADDNSVEGYQDAIKKFQKRHGIKADGIVGKETLSKLNISVEEKIEAIRLNMERWRWMPDKIEHSYIAVNIPDYSLSLINDDTQIMQISVIVGKEERPTPIFNAKMTYIVVNPYWRVPNTILQEDIIPKMRKDIGYLKKEKIRIFKYGDKNNNQEIDPASINWESASADTFPYFLRQDAGEKNVLGHLKFMFPNPYDIYIHDTPDKYLFDKRSRGLSSGCIRIEDSIPLAEYLLGDSANEGNVTTLIAGGETKKIPLSEPIRVYVNYWTVWADDEGTIQFRDDLYGYDRELSEILGWHHNSPN